MSTRQLVEQLNAALEQSRIGMTSLPNAPARENMNSIEQDLGLLARFAKGKSIEDWKIDRLEKKTGSTQAVTSMISYKAEFDQNSDDSGANTAGLQTLWAEVQDNLKQALSTPVFETWIKSCRLDAITGNTVLLATSSEFNRELIVKRYRSALEQAFSTRMGQKVTVRLQVDPTLESTDPAVTQPEEKIVPPIPALNPKYPLARFQNPTNNPYVAALLAEYGDLRQVILKSSIFKTPCAKVEDGGWGTGVGGLIALAKEYTLERVLWAIQETKAYRGTREPGKYLNHIVRHGLETDS